MTRTTVSGIRPDKTGTGEWIDINSHVAGSCPRSWPAADHSASTPTRPA